MGTMDRMLTSHCICVREWIRYLYCNTNAPGFSLVDYILAPIAKANNKSKLHGVTTEQLALMYLIIHLQMPWQYSGAV